ncbi:YciI family protein [Solirubrobacter sp. CPCC 204708]|uniref:YciI family protein n=1 Tax=Solirubrobacter deserti TaxID=2282478 RepID=A0ABT4RW58_9ACTN|nr:YciI family protein [Solirubrobacter deserti]MBE2318933.1 YciI family protein [Solirubrobacter deserti]MDA0142480.1 YciI family protein [Solirubrobacter deserti]
MNYLLTLYYRDGEGPQQGTPEFDAEMKIWNGVLEDMKRDGVYVAASGLKPETATTLRRETVTDGPYAETKEILFSFIIIDVPDLDAALAWSRKLPSTEYGAVQIHATEGLELA